MAIKNCILLYFFLYICKKYVEMGILSLDAFKSMLSSNNEFKNSLISKNDIIDWDNGTMVIYSENINKYLEKYACKDADDLIDTLWYSYGVFVKII